MGHGISFQAVYLGSLRPRLACTSSFNLLSTTQEMSTLDARDWSLKVFLVDPDDDLVCARIEPATPEDANTWNRQCVHRLTVTGEKQPKHVHSHWDWTYLIQRTSVRPDLWRSFAIKTRGGVLQGLCALRLSNRTSIMGEPLVAIEYIATAPWNLGRRRYLRGVGTTFIIHTVLVSYQMGFGGRIGLSSLKVSESFYRQLGLRAYKSNPTGDSLTWFEFSSESCVQFLRRRSLKLCPHNAPCNLGWQVGCQYYVRPSEPPSYVVALSPGD